MLLPSKSAGDGTFSVGAGIKIEQSIRFFTAFTFYLEDFENCCALCNPQ